MFVPIPAVLCRSMDEADASQTRRDSRERPAFLASAIGGPSCKENMSMIAAVAFYRRFNAPASVYEVVVKRCYCTATRTDRFGCAPPIHFDVIPCAALARRQDCLLLE